MSFRPVFLVKALLLLVWASAVPAAAQLVPLGPPMRVTGGFNICPEVFAAADGGFGVAWMRAQDAFSFRCTPGSLELVTLDSEGRLSPSGVRRIARTGSTCVEDFRILQPEGGGGATAVWQWRPGKYGSVGVSALEVGSGGFFHDPEDGWIRPLRSGGFVVLRWSGGDGYLTLVAERFESPGSPVLQRFRVTRFTGAVYRPEVTETPDGVLFFVWAQSEDNGLGSSIRGRRFDALGEPLGESFEITRPASFPSVVSNEAGQVAVTWVSGDENRVLARIYGADGEPEGPEHEVSSVASPYQTPAVAMDPEGRLAVFWHRFPPYLGNPQKSKLLGRLVGDEGEPLGSEVLVTSQAARPIGCESVATNGKSWMLAWQGWGAQGYGIYVQRFGSRP